MMSPSDLFRHAQARQAAIRQYAAAYDHFGTEQQKAVGREADAEAEGARQHAEWVLRAYKAELDDSQPGPHTAHCSDCFRYEMRPDRERLS